MSVSSSVLSWQPQLASLIAPQPCQALATRVQAVPPPPPPPPPPSNSARLIKVLKRPVGTQLRFSNLDGARASVSSEDRLSTFFERQEEVEDGEEEEKKEEEEGKETREKRKEKKKEEAMKNSIPATFGH